MRVIQVINVRWFNATSWYALYLARLLQAAGHQCLVLALEGTETHAKAVKWGLEVRTLPLNSNNPLTQVRLWSQLRSLIQDFKPDVINCHRGEAFILFGLLRELVSGFALVRTRGDQRLPKDNLPNRWLHNSCADAVVATNSVMHAHFRKTFNVPTARLKLVLGGVDRTAFAPSPQAGKSIRAEFGYGDDDCVIGILGRFDEVKGQRELIQAVAKLRDTPGMSNIRLMLLGFATATSQGEVESWIREAGIADITRITGERPDIAACINALDVGVVASKWSETIARAALEIMACERPLVGTTVGVMPDLLQPDALFPPGDVDSMAAVLQRAVTDKSYRDTLVLDQRRRMADLSGEDFLAKTLALYREARP